MSPDAVPPGPPSPALMAGALEHLADLVVLSRPLRDHAGTPVDALVVWVNASTRARQPTGADPVGRRWSQVWPRSDSNGSLDAVLQAFGTGGPVDGEVDWQDAGTFATGRYAYRATLLEEETLLWVAHDVSDRRLATRALADQERRLRRALAKLEGLQGLSAALAGAITVADAVRAVTEVAFTVVGADRVGLALLDDDGRVLVPRPMGQGSPADPGSRRETKLTDDHPLAACVREQRPIFLEDRLDLIGRWPQLASRTGGQRRAYLPLVGDGSIGAITVVWDRSRSFSSSERAFLRTMAAQCTQAVERAVLFERTARAAATLQRALLPARLPTLPGVACAARYLTAAGDDVGGDWYDVLALPGGAIGVVMGDVAGHSAAAAAIMGQARNVLRAYAAEGHTPSQTLGRLNAFLCTHADTMVTCAYLELRPSERLVTAVSAGHPSPLVVEASGRVRSLDVVPGAALGVDPAERYQEQSSVLPEGGSLVLYTDGLVEAGLRGPHVGVEGLSEAIERLATADAERLAEGLTAAPPGPRRQRDDAALLVVHLTGGSAAAGTAPTASRVFAPTPTATPAARRFVHDVLHDWGLDALRDDAALLVCELVTNAVLHTASQVRLSVRRLGPGRVWIGVQDDSDRMPRLVQADEDDIGGRGLTIVDLVAYSWGVDPVPAAGKTVWLELRTEPETERAAV